MNSKGQAIFEFIVFLPLLIIVYTTTLKFGDSVNASINQQKAARGYFFARTKGNSRLPRADDLFDKDWNLVGMMFTGWAESMDSSSSGLGDPFASCFKIQSLIDSGYSEDCEMQWDKTTTQFVKVRTAFGVCTTTYRKDTTSSFYEDPIAAADYGGCVLSR